MTTNKTIREAAEELARDNREAEPNLIKIYLFPSQDEIRLVEIDPSVPPLKSSTSVTPFYFGPDTVGGVPYRTAVALVRPEEDGKASLPAGWGGWNDAVILWRAGS
jgi:hypothetical protein